MAVLQGSYTSECLNQETHFMLIRPFEGRKTEREKILILLHGLMDNSTAWVYKTALPRLCEAYGVTAFCPEGHRGFYCDMAFGGRYRTLVTEEVPKAVKGMFGLELNGENTVVAGNSMGGYGALKAVFSENSLYQKGMAFSPVIDPAKALEVIPESYRIPGEERAVLGMEGRLPKEEDLYALAGRRKKNARITITCGRKDFLIKQNRAFHEYLDGLGWEHTYREDEGEHGWEYWDRHLEELFLEYF